MKTKVILSAVAGYAALSTMGASAQQQPTVLPTLSVTGEDLSNGSLELNTPTSTGSRLNLTPKETPASVEVMSGETVRERGYQSVSDAVSHATGFTTVGNNSNGGTSLTARGFAGQGSVMQLYDGTRLYVGTGTVTSPFDTWSIDRIEILRGPASVMYGEGAIGGVINVVPKKPTRTLENEAQVEFGTDLTRRLAASSSGPLGSKLSYFISGNVKESEGYVDNGDNASQFLRGAIRLDAAENLNFTLSHDYGHQNPMRYWGTPLRGGLLDESLRKKNYNVGDADVDYLDTWTQFKTEWHLNDSLTFNNVAYTMTANRKWRNVEQYALNPATNVVTRTDYVHIEQDHEQTGNRADLTYENTLFGLKNQSVVGFDVNRIEHTRRANNFAGSSTVNAYDFDQGVWSSTGQVQPGATHKADQYAIFGEDRLVLNDQWSLAGGLRFDHIDYNRDDLNTGAHIDKTYTAWSWRGGAVYNLTKDTALYGQYATATSPVGSSLLGQSATNASQELSTAKQYELGVKQTIQGGKGEWTFAGYHITKNKLQTRNATTPSLVEQVGEQQARGIEAAISLELAQNWRLDANAALVNSEFTNFVTTGGADLKGKRPLDVPERLANAWLTWSFAPEWKATAAVRYVGDTYSDNANLHQRPDYFVADLGLTWAPTDRLNVALRVFNIFDEIYANSSYGDNQWVLAPPRTAYLTTTVKF